MTLSLNLENPEVLDDMHNLNTSVTEVISQMSNEPIAGPSGMQEGATDFAVEIIRPLPKAPLRVSSNKRRARKSTDTPEKNSLEEEHNIREMKKRNMATKTQNKENKKDKGKGKGKGKGNINKDEKVGNVEKRILNESDSSYDDEDYFCIICGAYNDDTSGGEWIQCITCKDWALAGCIKGDMTSFCCLNCNSDDESE